MLPAEAAGLSAYISEQAHASMPGRAKAKALRLDTFRYSYIEFQDTFVWPSISLGTLDLADIKIVTEILLRFIPDWILGCSILPEARPKKDSTKLCFCRVLSGGDIKYMYILKVACQHLGGGRPTFTAQGRSPQFETNRIYFTARIVPVEQTFEYYGYITDFQPAVLPAALYTVFPERGDSGPRFKGSALFDEIDFGEMEKAFAERFAFGETWPMPNLFLPFKMEYLTLCLNVAYPASHLLQNMAAQFGALFETRENAWDVQVVAAQTQEYWRAYYRSFAYDRCMSASGNPHWTIVGCPGWQGEKAWERF